MSVKKLIPSDVWTKVNTTAADVLLTAGKDWYLFMGGNEIPTTASEGHLISGQPVLLPKGVGAYVRALNGRGDLYMIASQYTPGTDAPADPWS